MSIWGEIFIKSAKSKICPQKAACASKFCLISVIAANVIFFQSFAEIASKDYVHKVLIGNSGVLPNLNYYSGYQLSWQSHIINALSPVLSSQPNGDYPCNVNFSIMYDNMKDNNIVFNAMLIRKNGTDDYSIFGNGRVIHPAASKSNLYRLDTNGGKRFWITDAGAADSEFYKFVSLPFFAFGSIKVVK